MFKRYLLTLLSFILLLLAYGVSLIPLLIADAGLSVEVSMNAFLVWGLLVLVSLFPAMAMIIRKIWFFKGKGEPIPYEALKTALLMINEGGGPAIVKEKRKGLIVSWNYQEPKWCRLMDKLELSQLYELHLSFDTATKTVNFSDKTRSIRFLICSEKVKVGLLGRPSPVLKVNRAKGDSLKSLTDATGYDHSFNPSEIKSPVLDAVLQSGWNARFHLL